MKRKLNSKPNGEDDYFTRSGLKEVQLLRKYFGIEGQGENVKLMTQIRPEDIKNFYREYFASVRPPKLAIDKILPKPDTSKLRALYVGDADANTLLNLIVRHALYVDQILLVDPFLIILRGAGGSKNVLESPELWLESVLNKAFALCALEDWIREGIVVLFPNLFYYYPDLIETSIQMIPEGGMRRTPRQKAAQEHWQIMKLLVQEAPEARNSMIDLFQSNGANFTEDEIESLLREAEYYENENPIRFRLTPEDYDRLFGEAPTRGQMQGAGTGIPMPLASLFAKETGSFLIFEEAFLYEFFSTNFGSSARGTDVWQQLSGAFQKLDFHFLNNVPLRKALEIRRHGYFKSFRNYLLDLWATVSNSSDGPSLDNRVRAYIDRLEAEYAKLDGELKDIQRELRIHTLESVGFGVAAAASEAVATGKIEWITAAAGVGTTLLKGISGYASIERDRNKLYRKSIGVFLKLAH